MSAIRFARRATGNRLAAAARDAARAAEARDRLDTLLLDLRNAAACAYRAYHYRKRGPRPAAGPGRPLWARLAAQLVRADGALRRARARLVLDGDGPPATDGP